MTAVENVELTLGGRPLRNAWDRLCRYCGLPWSGGQPEVWAYGYFDAVPSGQADVVSAVDVLAAGVLHPGLSRDDLAFFTSRRDDLAAWLEGIPHDADLADSDDSMLDGIADVAAWRNVPSFTLLTKVLHRKRPGLIPIVDREVLDWYRPITRDRTAVGAWPRLVGALRSDLRHNASALDTLVTRLAERDRCVTPLRAVDIAIWMGGRA